MRILDEPAPTASSAAGQLGTDVGAIANSLIFATDTGEAVLVLASGAHRVDPDLLAGLFDATSVQPASRSAALLPSGIQ